jgi:hypothetical protein
LLEIHLRLSSCLTQHDWGFTAAQGYLTLTKVSTKQKDKFSRLRNTPHPTHTTDGNKVVINLSNKELDPAASSILAKGLNFAHTTNPTLNIRDIISGVERAVMGLSTESAEEIRRETCHTLRKNEDAEE